MNKNEALRDFVEKYVKGQWQHEFIAIDEEYRKNKESIDKGLKLAFESLCKKAIALQEIKAKGKIKYIYFSFLRTSIMENTAFYRLDAYDEKWFLDKQECSVMWDADFIFRNLFNHIEEIQTKTVAYARKITPIDIEEIKFCEALKYNTLTIEFLKEMVPVLIECEAYKEMVKDTDITILAGEFMDISEVLYESVQDGKVE